MHTFPFFCPYLFFGQWQEPFENHNAVVKKGERKRLCCCCFKTGTGIKWSKKQMWGDRRTKNKIRATRRWEKEVKPINSRSTSISKKKKTNGDVTSFLKDSKSWCSHTTFFPLFSAACKKQKNWQCLRDTREYLPFFCVEKYWSIQFCSTTLFSLHVYDVVAPNHRVHFACFAQTFFYV